MRKSIGSATIALTLLGGGVALADPPPPPTGAVQPMPAGAFATWAAGVRSRIAQFSRPPKNPQKIMGATIVHFVVTQDGHIADAAVSTSSGCGPCDDAALRAVAQAQPFPPIPPDAGRDRVDLSVPIRFHTAPPRPRAAHKGPA